MEVGKLDVQLRTNSGKGVSRKLRALGKVPGVCYGVGLDQPIHITVDPKELKGSLDPDKGQNTVIDVTVKDGDKAAHSMTAMLWEYQVHPIKREVLHIDLIAIDPNKEIDVDVRVEFIGKAKGIVEGGQIHIVRRIVPSRCKPADIPISYIADLGPLGLGDNLHVSDINFPAGVEPTVSTSLSLVSCVAPRGAAETVEVGEGEEVTTDAAAKTEGDK